MFLLRPPIFSEKRTGNIAKTRLLVNPYGPEIQIEFFHFLRENDLNSEKGEEFTNPLPTAMFPFLLLLIYLLRCEPFFQGTSACKTQENCVSAGGGRHSKSLMICVRMVAGRCSHNVSSPTQEPPPDFCS